MTTELFAGGVAFHWGTYLSNVADSAVMASLISTNCNASPAVVLSMGSEVSSAMAFDRGSRFASHALTLKFLTPMSLLATVQTRSIAKCSSIRSFSVCARRLEQQERQRHSLEHPQYRGLYYHPIQSPPMKNAYAVSFLDDPPPNISFSPTTIGILHERGSANNYSESPPDLVPRNFEENREFKEVMHDILRDAIKGDLTLDTLAKNRPDDGFMSVDERIKFEKSYHS